MNSNHYCQSIIEEEGSEEITDCPICLSPLEKFDYDHPIQCSSHHCHFNFCLTCIESLIKSTKEESIDASDGNVFKLLLHCPNCRSNLGPSIRDTVLLRKVDKYRGLNYLIGNNDMTVKDEELQASQIRFKYALQNDETVLLALRAALEREKEFINYKVRVDDNSIYLRAPSNSSFSGSFGSEDDFSQFDDEEGFEADLEGRPKSFLIRHKSMNEIEFEKRMKEGRANIKPDETLLCGLEAFMSDEEKQFITKLLTSGESNSLAEAAEILDHIACLSRSGIVPTLSRKKSMHEIHKRRSMMSSIREAIDEGNEMRMKRHQRNVICNATDTTSKQQRQFHALSSEKRAQKVKNDLEIKKQMEYMALYPLPARLPKYAELNACPSSSFSLTFLDDSWDGTVLDAFSKITVYKDLVGNVTITKHQYDSRGIRNIIGICSSKHDGKGIMDIETPRVIVASLSRDAGIQGIVIGDVVSHVNGEKVVGTAADLRVWIASRTEGEVLTFTFNADAAVAEALRRRSLLSVF